MATASPQQKTKDKTLGGFLTQLQGKNRFTWADALTYGYLIVGTLVMFVPIIWLVMSSFKTPQALVTSPTTFLPYTPRLVTVEGFPNPLPLYDVVIDGQTLRLAEVSRVGIQARMIDPANPTAEPITVSTRGRQQVMDVRFAVENYTGALETFKFETYLANSVIVTVVATLLTLLVNSMAAFGLSKYQFRGRNLVFYVMISTLLVPLSVIMVPVAAVIGGLELGNNLWGLIIPGAATPTGVFLLRQYMLTLPDELLDAARVDGAGEWRIYWSIILPLTAPALAVLTIFSVMWRWNDYLWPLIVISEQELFTLPIALANFQGELNVQWHYILAMSVLTIIPITVVFAFLQRFITSGIATTGIK
jgi:alpha-1,4-digalacturonate transport system permease protein